VNALRHDCYPFMHAACTAIIACMLNAGASGTAPNVSVHVCPAPYLLMQRRPLPAYQPRSPCQEPHTLQWSMHAECRQGENLTTTAATALCRHLARAATATVLLVALCVCMMLPTNEAAHFTSWSASYWIDGAVMTVHNSIVCSCSGLYALARPQPLCEVAQVSSCLYAPERTVIHTAVP
jgi:hypothetical protein